MTRDRSSRWTAGFERGIEETFGSAERRAGGEGKPVPGTTLRERIVTARKARKISQGALAKLVGLTSGDISRMELGYQDIRPAHAQAIAAALGLSGLSLKPVVPAAPAPGLARLGAARPEPAAPATFPPLPAPPSGHALASTPEDYLGAPDLGDPPNFSELPDFRLLEIKPGWDVARLKRAIGYANTILHTSRVPAAVWREWRAFEKDAAALLKRESAGTGT